MEQSTQDRAETRTGLFIGGEARQTNDTWSGLCSSVWSADGEHADAVAARLRTGPVFVNAHNAPWLDQRAPFGGFNQSGMGREMGLEGILACTDTHSTTATG